MIDPHHFWSLPYSCGWNQSTFSYRRQSSDWASWSVEMVSRDCRTEMHSWEGGVVKWLLWDPGKTWTVISPFYHFQFWRSVFRSNVRIKIKLLELEQRNDPDRTFHLNQNMYISYIADDDWKMEDLYDISLFSEPVKDEQLKCILYRRRILRRLSPGSRSR